MKKNNLLMPFFLILTELSNGQIGINDNIKNDFPLIYNTIIEQATGKYPNDQVKQLLFIKEHCDACFDVLYPNAYVQIQGKDLPPEVWEKIWSNSFNKFSKKDFKYAPCNNIKGKKNEIDCMYSYALVNWGLVKFEILEQIETYKKTL